MGGREPEVDGGQAIRLLWVRLVELVDQFLARNRSARTAARPMLADHLSSRIAHKIFIGNKALDKRKHIADSK
jgi:hypothetical protein